MSAKKPEITFKYIFPYDYNPLYVNGAQGGISPRGEIIANFFVERPPLPLSVSNELNPDGTIGQEAGVEPADLKSSMVRYVSTGVILNYQTAREIHQWLGEKIREMEFISQAKAEAGMPQGERDKH